MTFYDFSVISTHGFPFFHLEIKPIPKGLKAYLRFYNFCAMNQPSEPEETKFELKAGLVSALYNFSNSIDKQIEVLEFKTKKSESQENNRDNSGDVLITVTTESYLFHDQVRKKIDLIYNKFIYPRLPLDSSEEISSKESDEIIEVLCDVKAQLHINSNKEKIKSAANQFLTEMDAYGLKAIIITSMDLSPLICFSHNKSYSLEDIDEILRNIGNIPDIEPFDWKYRQSSIEDKPCWVFLINSGVGITVENLFESYYYLLITTPNSYLAEFPSRLSSAFNDILT